MVDGDGGTVGDGVGEQGPADAGFELVLQESAQRARPVDGVKAFGSDVLPRRVGEFQIKAALGQAPVQVFDKQVNDAFDLGQGERFEQHDVVEAVEELWPEVAAQLGHHRDAGVILDLPIGGDALEQVLGAQIARHDNHGVAEVDGAALGIGEPAVVKQLQQGVEHVGVGLFDLVEQHHRVGLAADCLGELAAFLVPM